MLLTGVNMAQSDNLERHQSLLGRTKGRLGAQKANQSISAGARLALTAQL